MNRLFSTVTCFFVAISTPAIALAETHIEHKYINYDGLLASNSGWNSQSWIDNDISEKSIIKNSRPSQGSFQVEAEIQSKWSNSSKPFKADEIGFDSKHEGAHWNELLTNQQHRDDEGSFHDQMVNAHEWKHEIEHGEHEMEDDHLAQPVPEPGTFLMMVLGVLSFSLIRRRQH